VNTYLGVNESLLNYTKQCATRDILKELHISEYLFPIKGIFLSGSPADVPIAKHSVLKELFIIW